MPSSDLEAHFKKFGEIVAFSLNKGFGFIQYEEVESAKEAFKAQSPTVQGRRLVVKPAVNSSWGPGAVAQQQQQLNLAAMQMDGPSNDNKFMPKVWNTGVGPMAAMNRLNMGPHMNNNSNNGQGSFEPTNDCEIIVLSRALTTYAESIESRLRSLGLTVDLLFPNSEVPLGKVLSNISGRGCLYAILVTPLNEEHRSITVNILYGQPAEHRNMPVDDAISFIDKNFANYREQQASQQLQAAGVKVIAHRHSDAIQQLLRALAENRTMTVLQYDTIIQYLQERRDVQIKEELGDAAAKMIPDKTEEEKLQEKIMSILDKPTMTNTMKSIEVEAPDMVLENGMEILLDLKVQRALDSLLKSCISFK